VTSYGRQETVFSFQFSAKQAALADNSEPSLGFKPGSLAELKTEN
jgi:hypothetical protein